MNAPTTPPIPAAGAPATNGIELLTGDEIIGLLLACLDALVERVGPDEVSRLFENELNEFKVSSVNELRQLLECCGRG
jgi:hypothetical protein